MASCETSRVIEKCVAGANPKELVRESAVYKTHDLLEFKLGVSEDFIEALTQVKDLLSQRDAKSVSSEEALLKIMREFIEKNDPVKKAQRADLKREKHESKKRMSQLVPGTVKKSAAKIPIINSVAPKKRKPIKRFTLHAIALRDQNRCTFTSAPDSTPSSRARSATIPAAEAIGFRCDQKRWLDVHHIMPIHLGGSDEATNLTTLCKAHHKLIHRTQ